MYTHDLPKSFNYLTRSACLSECLRLAKEHQHAPDTLLSAMHLADRYVNASKENYSQELAHIVTVLAAKAHEDKGYSSVICVWAEFQNSVIIDVWVQLLEMTELYVPRFLIVDTILRATFTQIDCHVPIEPMDDESMTEDNMSEDNLSDAANFQDNINAYVQTNALDDLIWNITYTIADKNSLLRHDIDYQRLLSLAAMFLLSRDKLQYSRSASQVLFASMIESLRVNCDLETEDILERIILDRTSLRVKSTHAEVDSNSTPDNELPSDIEPTSISDHSGPDKSQAFVLSSICPKVQK